MHLHSRVSSDSVDPATDKVQVKDKKYPCSGQYSMLIHVSYTNVWYILSCICSGQRRFACMYMYVVLVYMYLFSRMDHYYHDI